MREDRWVVAVLLVSLVLQVQATYTSSEYYRGGACPFRADVGGSFTAPELSPIAGVPGTDPNFFSYLWQQLCKGSCHKPLKPLTTDDNILDMLKLNTNFQCENKDVRLNRDDVLKSWNAQVQKPVCEVVGDTVVCIVNTVHQIIYVNIFLLTCAVNHKIFVVSPGETFGNFQCYLTPNLYATLLHDVFESDFLSNPKTDVKKSERPNLVFAPESLGKVVLTYLKLWHLMPATKTLQEYDHLLKKWGQVCGENTGHNTTAVCTSMTAKMAKVCKKVLTDKDSDEIAGIKKCVNDFYTGLEKSTKDAEAHDYWCGLKKWEMDKEMTECVNSKSNPLTPKEHGGPFAFISSICGTIFYMGGAVFQFFSTVCGAVSWVWNWYECASSSVYWVLQLTWMPIAVAWAFKTSGIFAAFWACMWKVCKFAGELEKPAPGSNLSLNGAKYYFGGFLLSPFSFVHLLIKDSKQIIDESVSENSEKTKQTLCAEIDTKMSRNKQESEKIYTSTKTELLSAVDQKMFCIRKAHSDGLHGLKLEISQIADAAERVVREEFQAQEQRARPIGENHQLMLKLANKQNPTHQEFTSERSNRIWNDLQGDSKRREG
jgi:hypothetical protein